MPTSVFSPGDTSNKGACSLVLANSGPLRPPVRRTSAPLRCSSSPNGNGRFRWERSRREISELSPSGGSERYVACGDAFGRFKRVVLRRGEIEIPPPKRVFGYFLRSCRRLCRLTDAAYPLRVLHGQKGTPPEGSLKYFQQSVSYKTRKNVQSRLGLDVLQFVLTPAERSPSQRRRRGGGRCGPRGCSRRCARRTGDPVCQTASWPRPPW